MESVYFVNVLALIICLGCGVGCVALDQWLLAAACWLLALANLLLIAIGVSA
ncbi:MAG: hypothetical protein H6526_08935 [Actinobacteria bacterium]|nr:hypothetical protein [Actinomycetota bacterium]